MTNGAPYSSSLLYCAPFPPTPSRTLISSFPHLPSPPGTTPNGSCFGSCRFALISKTSRNGAYSSFFKIQAASITIQQPVNGATINSDYVVVQWATLGVASVKIELFEGFGEGKILGDNINTKASTFTWDARAAKASDQSDWRIKVSDTNQASVYAIVRVSVPNGPPKGTVHASLSVYVRFHIP